MAAVALVLARDKIPSIMPRTSAAIRVLGNSLIILRPTCRGGGPLAVLHGELELGPEVFAGLADDAAGDFAERFGVVLAEVGVELFEQGHGLFDAAAVGRLEEAAFQILLVDVAGGLDALPQVLNARRVGVEAADAGGLAEGDIPAALHDQAVEPRDRVGDAAFLDLRAGHVDACPELLGIGAIAETLADSSQRTVAASQACDWMSSSMARQSRLRSVWRLSTRRASSERAD